MKERVIYNSYDLWDDYADECIEYIKDFRDCHDEDINATITDDEIWQRIYDYDRLNWEDEYERLREFFNVHGHFIIRGCVGRWDGTYSAGYVFDNFDDMFYKATKDCDYIKMWDENGHFYLKCSHHDGTNLFEIKRLSDKGYEFIDNWEYDWNDKRTEKQIHDIVWNSNFLSSLPHYVHNIYGCKKYEK